MHCTAGFLVALMCLVAVNCTSLEKVRNKRQDQPVVIVDTGTSKNRQPFNPFFYDDFAPKFPARDRDEFDNIGFGAEFTRRLNAMLSGLQNQFNLLWRRFYDRTDKPFGPTFDDTLGPLPPSYHNTTSSKKVVNGSVITVNETIDKQSDNNSMSFFHVKVVHVRPENPLPQSSESTPPQPPRSLEPEMINPERAENPDNGVEHPESNTGKSDEKHPDIEDNMP